jgi:hypothetical protein
MQELVASPNILSGAKPGLFLLSDPPVKGHGAMDRLRVSVRPVPSLPFSVPILDDGPQGSDVLGSGAAAAADKSDAGFEQSR